MSNLYTYAEYLNIWMKNNVPCFATGKRFLEHFSSILEGYFSVFLSHSHISFHFFLITHPKFSHLLFSLSSKILTFLWNTSYIPKCQHWSLLFPAFFSINCMYYRCWQLIMVCPSMPQKRVWWLHGNMLLLNRKKKDHLKQPGLEFYLALILVLATASHLISFQMWKLRE